MASFIADDFKTQIYFKFVCFFCFFPQLYFWNIELWTTANVHCSPTVKHTTLQSTSQNFKNDESTTPLQQGDCLPLCPALTHPSVFFCLRLLTVTPRIVKPSESLRHWLPRHSSCTLWEDMVIYVPCHCHAVTCWMSGREQVERRKGWRKRERGGNSSSVLYMFLV